MTFSHLCRFLESLFQKRDSFCGDGKCIGAGRTRVICVGFRSGTPLVETERMLNGRFVQSRRELQERDSSVETERSWSSMTRAEA